MTEASIPEADLDRLHAAESDEERLKIEAELIEQSDNGLHDGDPEDQPTTEEASNAEGE